MTSSLCESLRYGCHIPSCMVHQQGSPPSRDGDAVTVSWQPVNMTEDDDRGYMIEAHLCQNGNLLWTAVATMGTTYTFTDETTCAEASNGLLYTVEKHGYTDPVSIPWP